MTYGLFPFGGIIPLSPFVDSSISTRLVLQAGQLDDIQLRWIALAQVTTRHRHLHGMSTALPVYGSGFYSFNGAPLDQIPIVASSPRPAITQSNRVVFLGGTLWTLVFASPSSSLLTLFPTGTTVRGLLSFPLASGEQCHALVDITSAISLDSTTFIMQILLPITTEVTF